MWTVDKVKAELPDVQCRFCNIVVGDKIYDCQISGRLNQFATVWAKKAQYLEAQFTWQAIVYSLNNNQPLCAN